MRILVLGDFQGKFPEKLKQRIKKEEFDLVVALGDYAGIEDFDPYLMKFFKAIKAKKPRPNAEEFYGKKRLRERLRKDDSAGRSVLKELSKLGRPVIFIYGNGDDRFHDYPFADFFKATKANVNYVNGLRNLKSITYGRVKANNIWFVGFGGYMDAMANYDKRKKEDRESLKGVYKRNKKAKKKFDSIIKPTSGDRIFVFHYPLKGVFDIIKDKKNPYRGGSTGVEFFTAAVKKYKPRLVLCAHMHEYQGKKRLGKSLVVNPGDAEKSKYAVIDYPDKGEIKVKFVG